MQVFRRFFHSYCTLKGIVAKKYVAFLVIKERMSTFAYKSKADEKESIDVAGRTGFVDSYGTRSVPYKWGNGFRPRRRSVNGG
jgi:hypothetical protein